MENHLSWSNGTAFGSGTPWASSPTITHDALAKFTQHFHATGRAENRSFAVLYAGEKAVFLACIGFVSVGGDVLRRPVNGHLSSALRKRRGDRFYSSARLQKLLYPFHAGEIAGMLPNGIQQAAFPGIPLIVLLRGEVMGVHSRGDDKAVVFSVGDKQLPCPFPPSTGVQSCSVAVQT